LPPITPHQLRHSAATNLVRAGIPIHLVSSLMNHSNVQTTMGYVSSGGEQLAEWKRKLT
jgi:integrase/recombinase XerC